MLICLTAVLLWGRHPPHTSLPHGINLPIVINNADEIERIPGSEDADHRYGAVVPINSFERIDAEHPHGWAIELGLRGKYSVLNCGAHICYFHCATFVRGAGSGA